MLYILENIYSPAVSLPFYYSYKFREYKICYVYEEK